MQIRIELLSDTCFSSGEVYNSSIDADVCYDAYGLPFLPAKRLKGCLREAAQELRDWGVDVPVEELFGAKRNRPSGLRLSDGCLEDYAQSVAALRQEKDRLLVHPQKVLAEYSYTRTQTRINAETGTAMEDTLRVTRVLKRGLVFLADVELQKEEYKDSLAQCCCALRCMGLNRTRGMGEVKAELVGGGSGKSAFSCEADYDPQSPYCRMDYRIELGAPLLCKSVAGGQARTMDYIDGAKLLGLIAQSAGDEFLSLMEPGELICSNAYICGPEGRCLPLAASVYRVKNDKKSGRDRAAGERPETVQLNAAGDQYVYRQGQEIAIREVETQIRYHHSRPADKSIGHVSKADAEKQMYQLESLTEEQSFAGYVLGTPEQLHRVFTLLKRQSHFRLGYSRSAEYGDLRLVVTGFEEAGERQPEMAECFLVKLNAPAILYNAYGMYSTDERELLREIERLLGAEGLRVEKRFLCYTEVGGYNTTWDARKPTLLALDKGTALVCAAETPVDIGALRNAFIGERCGEGYGEIEITPVPTAYELCFREAEEEAAEPTREEDSDCALIQSLKKKAARSDLESAAVENARGLRSFVKAENATAIVSQMLLSFREQDSAASFRGAIRERYGKRTDSKQAKLKLAERVMLEDEDFARLREAASAKYGGLAITEEEAYRWYYGALLSQLKYDVRHVRQEGVRR